MRYRLSQAPRRQLARFFTAVYTQRFTHLLKRLPLYLFARLYVRLTPRLIPRPRRRLFNRRLTC